MQILSWRTRLEVVRLEMQSAPLQIQGISAPRHCTCWYERQQPGTLIQRNSAEFSDGKYGQDPIEGIGFNLYICQKTKWRNGDPEETAHSQNRSFVREIAMRSFQRSRFILGQL